MSKLRFRVVETAFKKKPGCSGSPDGTSVRVLRQVCIQQGKDVQVPAKQGICQVDRCN